MNFIFKHPELTFSESENFFLENINYIVKLQKQLKDDREKLIRLTNESEVTKDFYSLTRNEILLQIEILSNFKEFWKQQNFYHPVFGYKPNYQPDTSEIEKDGQQNFSKVARLQRAYFLYIINMLDYAILKNIHAFNAESLFVRSVGRTSKAYAYFLNLEPNLKEETHEGDFSLIGLKKMLKDLPPADSLSRVLDSSKDLIISNQEQLERMKIIIKFRNIATHAAGEVSDDLKEVLPFLCKCNHKIVYMKESEKNLLKLPLLCMHHLCEEVFGFYKDWFIGFINVLKEKYLI